MRSGGGWHCGSSGSSARATSRGEPSRGNVRASGWIRSFVMWPPLRAAWAPFITSRLAVLVVAYIAVFTVGFSRPVPPFRALDNDWLALYGRWDAGWYFGIASVGYPSAFNPCWIVSIAFFPGLPLVMRAVHVLLDVNLWVGASSLSSWRSCGP